MDDGTNDAAEANIIANNAKSVNPSNQSSDGVRVTANASQNRISRNVFYSNKANPIDLANDGVSINNGATPAAQPNLLLDYPVFTSYSISGTTMTVSGYVGQCNGTGNMDATTISDTTTVQVYKVARYSGGLFNSCRQRDLCPGRSSQSKLHNSVIHCSIPFGHRY